MKVHPLFFVCLFTLFGFFSCAQKAENDTPEAFFERLKTALASPTRQRFDDEIMVSKSENREFCKVKVPYNWNTWPTDPNVEKSLDEMHEFEWNENLPRRQMAENWREGAYKIWADATISKVEMDSAQLLKRRPHYSGEWPNSVETTVFSAYFQLPNEAPFRVIAPVCRISGGRWKLIFVLMVHR